MQLASDAGCDQMTRASLGAPPAAGGVTPDTAGRGGGGGADVGEPEPPLPSQDNSGAFATPPADPDPSADPLAASVWGAAADVGGRAAQDDRHTCFSLRLASGRRLSVAAVLDGHHQHHLAQLVADRLPGALAAAAEAAGGDVAAALRGAVAALDDAAWAAHASGALPTGGTTLLLHALCDDGTLTTANVGDCKGLLSARGAPEPLCEAHNPPAPAEAARFAAAGVQVFGDHIQGCDINVCRTLGDYDLGAPLKWRCAATGERRGPLSPEPELRARRLEPDDEFVVAASDGLWDYYTPESSVVTDARRELRASGGDAQRAAEWLVARALARQRATLHAGTPGDNVTVLVVALRRLPRLPTTSESRLNLRARAHSGEAPPAGGGAGRAAPDGPPGAPAREDSEAMLE